MTGTDENRSVRELAALQPHLREDLRFTWQEQGGRRVCVIEDPAASRFHRVGVEEYCFLRSLDGCTTVAGLIAKLATSAETEALRENEALQIVQWARSNHLLLMDAARGPSSAAPAWQAATTWLNPLSIKVPLARPDRFFQTAAQWLQPALNGFGLFVWLVVLAIGAAHLAPEWARFRQEADGFLARDNWLWLGLGWAGLKALHEFGHGVLCRHFGARVREVGVMFILGLPLGYVDATASLALPARRQRIAVAAAGVGVEFLAAALAAIVWARTGPGTLHTLAHDLVITGTVVTLFFNANPLMRFDGYFILSDLLDVPNLASRGRQWMQRAQQWVLLGSRSLRPAKPASREEWLVVFYGTAAWLWQWTVTAGLLMAASTMLRGGGLLFAAIAGAIYLGSGLTQTWQSLAKAVRSGGSTWSRLALRSIVCAALVAMLLFLPWRRVVAEPAVVELAETEILRAECAGFVESLHVADGATVEAGTLLVELRNDEASAQLRRTRAELAQQEMKARLAYTRQDVGTFQAESAKTDSLRQSVAQLESYLATMQVRAPFAGTVTSRKLSTLVGRFIEPGEEILRLGRTGAREVKIAVSARNEPHFREALGHGLKLRLPGRGQTVAATLTQIDAHASRENAWPALTVLAGGPVALRRAEKPREESAAYELAEPCFTATARLEEDFPLLPGETGNVRFRSATTVTLWAELSGGLQRWMAKYAQRQG